MQAILLWLILVCSTLQESYGSSIYMPCRTIDKFQETLQCSINNTIYIQNHIIEDGINRITPSDTVLGCKEKNRFICSASFPRDKERLKTHLASNCNQRNVCVTKPILRKIQNEMKTKLCPVRQELKKTTSRHSVEYLCIPETQQQIICENKMSQKSHPTTFFKSYNCSEECYCDLNGQVYNISILESFNTTFIISNSSANTESGQFAFECMIVDRKMSTSIGNESTHKRSTEVVLNHKITSSLSPRKPVAKAEKWSTPQNGNSIITTMENSTQWHNVFTTFRMKTSEETQMHHLYKMPAKEQDISIYVIYFMAGMILLGLIFIVISVLQKRKEKDTLEMILQRLQTMANSSFPQIKLSSSNRKSETLADITYQQIPVDIKVQTNTKSVQNATYGIDNSTRIYSLCNGEDLTKKMEVHGVYELQKITD